MKYTHGSNLQPLMKDRYWGLHTQHVLIYSISQTGRKTVRTFARVTQLVGCTPKIWSQVTWFWSLLLVTCTRSFLETKRPSLGCTLYIRPHRRLRILSVFCLLTHLMCLNLFFSYSVMLCRQGNQTLASCPYFWQKGYLPKQFSSNPSNFYNIIKTGNFYNIIKTFFQL